MPVVALIMLVSAGYVEKLGRLYLGMTQKA